MHEVDADGAGMIAGRLSRVDEFLTQRYIAEGKLPGTIVGIVRGGKLAHLSALGLRDRERGLPMERDTIVRIYSMTKPITAVALMMLYERGLFQLSDPIEHYIPAWKDLRVWTRGVYPQFLTEPLRRPMTVRDLLMHTSGLTYGFNARTNVDAAYRKLGIGVFGADARLSLSQMIERVPQVPLEFSPGERWNYSISTDVCGYLVQLLSGRPFEQYVRAEILQPLGMVDTDFQVPQANWPRLAACYEFVPGGAPRLQDDPETSVYRKPPVFVSGGAGLVSTVHDYLRFCRMLLGRGELDGTRILGRKTLELMTQNHLPDGADLAQLATGSFSESQYEGVGFGLGFSVSIDPKRAQVSGTPGEFAWGGLASTAFWVDPVEDLAVVFLTQLMPSRSYPLRIQLKQLIYAALR